MKLTITLTITTLVIIEDHEVQDVIHSLNENPDKAKEEIISQVNNIYGSEELTFYSIQGITEYFDHVHLECQEISLQTSTDLKNITL